MLILQLAGHTSGAITAQTTHLDVTSFCSKLHCSAPFSVLRHIQLHVSDALADMEAYKLVLQRLAQAAQA